VAAGLCIVSGLEPAPGGAPVIPPTETGEILPIPEGRVADNAIHVAGPTLVGASYVMRRRAIMNRLILRVAMQVGAPTGRFLIYQATGGGSGVAALIASVTGLAIGAPGNFVALFTQGLVTFEAGLIYILYGHDNGLGSFTLRTYKVHALDLLTANVDTDTHPTSFTTAILSTTAPATFDPREAPSGAATGTSTDVPGVFRLKKV
jgi:hypothetical protein